MDISIRTVSRALRMVLKNKRKKKLMHSMCNNGVRVLIVGASIDVVVVARRLLPVLDTTDLCIPTCHQARMIGNLMSIFFNFFFFNAHILFHPRSVSFWGPIREFFLRVNRSFNIRKFSPPPAPGRDRICSTDWHDD